MPAQTWRRQHGSDLVAQVAAVEGFDRWAPSAWLTSNPSLVVITQRTIETLPLAQAAADHIARKNFDHTCDSDTCGEWMFWPR
jgi:hypothetical protein